MSDIENEDVIETPDELTALKARADLLGISYHPSIGIDKLRDKVNGALAPKEPEEDKPVVTGVESDNEKRIRLKKESSELIRIRVACMNPNKKEWEGEIFTVGNAGVGTFKKYVPFNADEGWHVPRIMYNMLVERQCQVFVTVRDPRGNTHRKGKLIKEFAVEVLPPLTEKELAELARRQAMSKSAD